jgi:hypothetical protein
MTANPIPTHQVVFYDGNQTVTVKVTAENRGKAITAASHKTGIHRDFVLEAYSLNPMSGGGKVGHR